MTRSKIFYVALERDDKRVADVVEATFRRFESIGGVDIPRSYIGNTWAAGEFGSMQWYIRNSFVAERGQVNLDKLTELLRVEPWQKRQPHYELFVLETDAFAKGTNFLFGATNGVALQDGSIYKDKIDREGNPSAFSGTIISLNRIRACYKNEWALAFSTLLYHELGHFYGLASRSNPKGIFIPSKPLEYAHCDDRDCIMEQVNIPGRSDLLQKAKHIQRANSRLFCAGDEIALIENLVNLYTG